MNDKIEHGNPHTNESAPWSTFVFWFFSGCLLVAADQLTKLYAFRGKFGSFLNAFSPVVRKQVFINENFAFSLPVWGWLMYLIYVGVLLGIVVYVTRSWRYFTTTAALAWTLILSGGFSNVVERLVLGHVRDFIYIATGIFNLADVFILAGMLLLLVHPFVPKRILHDS